MDWIGLTVGVGVEVEVGMDSSCACLISLFFCLSPKKSDES